MPIAALNVREETGVAVEEYDDDVRFQTGSRNEPGSSMRIENYVI